MIYLDNAATTFPKPQEVYEKPLEFFRQSGGNPGRGAHYYSNASSEMIENTRRQAARFFGINNHHRVIFTYNCTDSINIVLKGLLKSGDHVIATCLDHNSVSRPLEHLAQLLPLEITRLSFDSSGIADPDAVKRALKKNTRLIIITHGSNVLGSVQPLQEFIQLAMDHSIPMLVDAAQTAGRIPIQLGDAPVFLACSAHKALFGMPGVGLLTVPANCTLAKWREGGSGSASESLEHPEDLPMRLEAGTPNSYGIRALQEGLNYIEREGMEKIHSSELSMASILRDSLVKDSRIVVYSPAGKLPIVSFNLRSIAPEEVATILDNEFGIAVRSGLHCAAVLHQQLKTSPVGCVRVSPGYFNTHGNIETLISALNRIAEAY